MVEECNDICATNFEMERMLAAITSYLDIEGIVGYALAKNYREIIQNVEAFENYKQKLIKKYGSKELDECGNETGRLYIDNGSEAYCKFAKEIEPVGNSSSSIRIFKVDEQDVIGILNAKQIIDLSWMILFDGGECN